jgi:hypothetical protein
VLNYNLFISYTLLLDKVFLLLALVVKPLMYFIDCGVLDIVDNGVLDGSMDKIMKSSSDKEYLKGHRIQPFPESGYPDDSFDFGDVGSLTADVQRSTAPKAEDDSQTNIDLALSNFQREYEVFELRIIHRKNRFTIKSFSLFSVSI